MFEISIPVRLGKDTGDIIPGHQGENEKGFYTFCLGSQAVYLTGSHRQNLSRRTCRLLVSALGRLDRAFVTGCSSGADRSFRYALARSGYQENTFIACAFSDRLSRCYGLFGTVVVPDGLSATARIRRRTLWMVKRCSLVILFADDPVSGTWGRDSRFIFRSALYHVKPLFIVTGHPPGKSSYYRIFPCSFFGVVDGYWIIPHNFAGRSLDEVC